MNLNISRWLAATLMSLGLGALAPAAPATEGAGQAGTWIAKPGIPAQPFIPVEAWAKSKFRDFYTTPKNWDADGLMAFVTYDPKLPRVLLIGDSISMGYTLDVRQMFKGKANVYRIIGNGGDATRFLGSYEKYLGAGTNWDLIHFNWGLHDLSRSNPTTKSYDINFPNRYTEDEYRQNLEKCVAILESTGAHLVWASTTAVTANSPGRKTGDEVIRNAIAAEIMQKHGIEINDLYKVVQGREDYHDGPGNVHFTGTGNLELAKQVVKVIEKKLGITANPVVVSTQKVRLVNHWRFNNSFKDEMTKSVAVPSDPKSYSFVPGTLSPCLNSAGGKGLNLGTTAGGLADLSVTVWLKVASLERTTTLLSKVGEGPDNVGWQITLHPVKDSPTAGSVWFSLGHSTDRKKVVTLRYNRAAFTVGQNKWHHLAVTFASATGTAEIYVDGVMITRATGISLSPNDLVSELKLNANGWVDDLQIWDGALPASRIKELVNQEGG